MDVISIVRKKHQHLTQFEVKINAPPWREHPQRFTRTVITYLVTGENVDEAAGLCLLERLIAKCFPLQFIVSQAFPMEWRYEIYEDEGNCN